MGRDVDGEIGGKLARDTRKRRRKELEGWRRRHMMLGQWDLKKTRLSNTLTASITTDCLQR
jgi:hypothetical protein